MDSSRPAILFAGPTATAGKRVPSLTSRRTATASGNYDRAKTQRLFWGTRFWRWCARCSARSRQREALSSLDDRALKDIGMTRQQANAEAAKPFWK
jgi:uncharacterized protein YjiS (DUF1127 family)